MNRNNLPSYKSWLTTSLLVMLGVINAFLIRQNLDLRRQLAAGARTLDLTTNVLKPGDIVSPVAATDLAGLPYQLEYNKDGRHRLLLFFSPNCPYCEQIGSALIQRCQLHKKRNVRDHLPKQYQASVWRQMNAAYAMRDYEDARHAVERLLPELMHLNPSAARSLEEGLQETLTIHRLGLPELLRRS